MTLGSRTTKLTLVATAVAMGTAATLIAQTRLNVKVGLWEMTTAAQTAGSMIDTSKMAPEQRARIEAAMKARSNAATTPQTRQTCITKEKLAKNGFDEEQRDNCKRTVVSQTATMEDIKVECTGERPSSSEIRFEALTPDSIKGNMKITTMRNGAPGATIDIAITGKWVAASCGDVK